MNHTHNRWNFSSLGANQEIILTSRVKLVKHKPSKMNFLSNRINENYFNIQWKWSRCNLRQAVLENDCDWFSWNLIDCIIFKERQWIKDQWSTYSIVKTKVKIKEPEVICFALFWWDKHTNSASHEHGHGDSACFTQFIKI